MSDRPIIFGAPMVRALLDGRKTQTRRVLRLPKWASTDPSHIEFADTGEAEVICRDTGCLAALPMPYAAGDRLWVRENHAIVPRHAYRASEGVQQTRSPEDPDEAAIYAAGWERSKPRWRPSIHMPRWASRLTLLVTDVRVERLNEIGRADAAAEGLVKLPATGRYVVERGDQYFGAAHSDPRVIFQGLWNSIHGTDAWEANPWVAAISFTVQHQNIDALSEVAA